MITQTGHPIAFNYETLNGIVIIYLTYEDELYAIVQALKKWRHYILGKEMIILTDHSPLQFVSSHSKLKKLDNSSGLITYKNFNL